MMRRSPPSLPPLNHTHVRTHPLQIAALLESEYTPEEVAAIGLTPQAELDALLDGLS